MREKLECQRSAWKNTWMEIVDVMAKRSSCCFYHIACLAVDESNKYPLVSGYNGPPVDEPHCYDAGCSKLDEEGNMKPPNSGDCIGCHAERNMVGTAADRGISLKKSIIYCTSSPCWDCAKQLVNLRIIKFVYKEIYKEDFEKVKKLFQRHGIEFKQYIGRK